MGWTPARARAASIGRAAEASCQRQRTTPLTRARRRSSRRFSSSSARSGLRPLGAAPAEEPRIRVLVRPIGLADDVGFITLPDGRRIAIAIFTRGGSDRPRTIAEAARTIYDGFAKVLTWPFGSTLIAR